MNARPKRYVRTLVIAVLAASASVALGFRLSKDRALHPDLVMVNGTRPIVDEFLTAQVPQERAAAWQRFQSDAGGIWRAQWDAARAMPSQVYGSGMVAPRSVTDATSAEAFARGVLQSHLDLLAPGAAPGDMVLTADVLNPRGDMRHVGFVQKHGGMPLVNGGGVVFSFKNDRLFLISSDAMPDISVTPPSAPADPVGLTRAARDHVVRMLGLSSSAASAVRLGTPSEAKILPVARGANPGKPATISYYAVYVVPASVTNPAGGAWDVYVDAHSGRVIGRQLTTRFANGTVAWKLGKRRPDADLHDVPAANTETSVGTTDGDGVVNIGSGGSVTLDTSGPLVSMQNNAGTSVLTSDVTAAAGGVASAQVSQTDIPTLAVFNTFAQLNLAKQFVRTHLNPDLSWLDDSLTASVNQNQTCNAYYDGNINMFQAGQGCQNTGALADVVIHEFGHGVHENSLVNGVRMDGAISEAHGDTLAMAVSGASDMGQGFFTDDPTSGLRNLAPAVKKRWPDDRTGEPHDDGEIYGESMWDLREALRASEGVEAGTALWERLWYASVQRAGSIPDSYMVILAEDDDDGDLTNGTPHSCVINAALDPHGLVPAGEDVGGVPSIGLPTNEGTSISVPFTIPPAVGSCTPVNIASSKLTWYIRGDEATGGEIDMTVGSGEMTADLPAQDDNTVIRYRIEVTLADGSVVSRPNNPADPDYELFVGRTEVIYCSDFESTTDEWTFDGNWAVGTPTGQSNDPSKAYSGSNVLGMNLDGAYDPDSQVSASVTVDGVAKYSSVRLQYRRWLSVEDGFFDHATIDVDGDEAWANYNSNMGNSSSTHHIDREWRFQDVDLTQWADDDSVTITFGLMSDPGLQLGGWNLDDVCVVGVVAPSCGDGYMDPGEACDDGNNTDGDGCAADCTIETGGGGGGGNESGGCCGVGGGAPVGSGFLGLLVLGLVIRRRRRTER